VACAQKDLFKLHAATILQAARFMLDLNTAHEMHTRIADYRTHDQEFYVWPFDYCPGRTAYDHGTSHVSVLAENGDAVSCTGTINL